MNSGKNTSLSELSATFSHLFHRFGFIVIFLIVAAGLIVSVFLLGSVIAKTDNPGDYAPDNGAITFDKTTIDALENLSKNSDVDTKGRLLPFW